MSHQDVWEQRCFTVQEQLAAQWQRQLEDSDADDGQCTRPQASSSQRGTPLTRAEQIKRAEHRAMWAGTAQEYDIAQRNLEALLRGEVVIDDHQAAELVVPREPILAPAPTTRKVLIKEVLARDSNGDVLRVKEYTITEPIPPEGTPPVDPERLLGNP